MTPDEIHACAGMLLDRASLVEMRAILRKTAGITSIHLLENATGIVPSYQLTIEGHMRLSESVMHNLSNNIMGSIDSDILAAINALEEALIARGVDIDRTFLGEQA